MNKAQKLLSMFVTEKSSGSSVQYGYLENGCKTAEDITQTKVSQQLFKDDSCYLAWMDNKQNHYTVIFVDNKFQVNKNKTADIIYLDDIKQLKNFIKSNILV